jgi:hypothetical protein
MPSRDTSTASTISDPFAMGGRLGSKKRRASARDKYRGNPGRVPRGQ